MRNSSHGIVHAWKALGYSLNGLMACLKHESAFRQEVFFGFINLIAAILVAKTWTETCILIILYLILPLVELVNSAIEEIVNLVSPEWNEKAKRAKDYGSAACFLAIITIIAAWCVVIVRRFA